MLVAELIRADGLGMPLGKRVVAVIEVGAVPRHGELVEPSGAVPAAVVLFRKLPPGIGSVGVILSGGNMDPAMLA